MEDIAAGIAAAPLPPKGKQKGSHPMFVASDDSAMMKEIKATHSPDGRVVDTKPILGLIESIFRHATLFIDGVLNVSTLLFLSALFYILSLSQRKTVFWELMEVLYVLDYEGKTWTKDYFGREGLSGSLWWCPRGIASHYTQNLLRGEFSRLELKTAEVFCQLSMRTLCNCMLKFIFTSQVGNKNFLSTNIQGIE